MVLGGCGGPIRTDELQRGVQSLAALAAEGAILADGTARDRTKATFTRVQARTLGEEADHESEKLADATAPPELARAKAAGVRGIIVFAEMSGRVAAIAGKANFDLVHDHFSLPVALLALGASLVLSVIT